MKLPPKHPEMGWAPYVFPIALVWIPAIPMALHSPLWYRAISWGAALVAAPVLVGTFWCRGNWVLWPATALTALGLALFPSNAGAVALFPFAACGLGELEKPKRAYSYLGVLIALIGLEAWLFHLPLFHWLSGVVVPLLSAPGAIAASQKRRLTRKLMAAREEVERVAQIAERERIARDLHDLLGHTLSVIILKSELASRLTESDPARAAIEIREVERVSREALAQVRDAVRGYRAAGLASELHQARGALETAGIRVEAAIDEVALPAAHEGAIALSLREAVTNVVRHSQATTCRVLFKRHGSYCELEVADNGRGGTHREGNGLSGMRERVELLGGVIEQDGSKGTVLRVRIPV